MNSIADVDIICTPLKGYFLDYPIQQFYGDIEACCNHSNGPAIHVYFIYSSHKERDQKLYTSSNTRKQDFFFHANGRHKETFEMQTQIH